MTLWHCAEFHYTAPYICLQCVSHYLWGGQFNNFAFWFVPSCSQLSSILLPSWFSVYLFRSLSEYQCVSKSMDPLKYFLKICAFGIWQNALFLPFGVTYFNLVIWHRFSIKHPSIGLTMIKSLKRGLNKELFGYRWVDNLGCWVWEGWCVLIQAM